MGSWFSRRDFLAAELKADQVELDGNRIRVHARSLDASAACPRCGTGSRHVHSKYWRRPDDLPANGREVELVLRIRRFRCRAVGCPAKIFSDQFPPAVTRPYARRMDLSRFGAAPLSERKTIGARGFDASGHIQKSDIR